MKKLFSLLIFSIAVIACNNNSKDAKTNPSDTGSLKDQTEKNSPSDMKQGRYGIKSAKVVTTTAMPGGMGNSEVTLYFEDYGKVSYTETVTKISMKGAPAQPKQYSVQQGDNIYSWTEGEKTGTKMNLAAIKNLNNLDLENLGKEMMEEMKIKKLGNETYLGKTCDVIEMNSATLGKGKILTWKKIPIFSDITTMGMNVKSMAKELEENPSIVPAKFKIPSDVVFKEMSLKME